ncbi:MAG: hypothetical protein OEL89_03175, partial [Candidatus Peregrinibacteria bacterium]|nr:hypothetical protein [Candidatus Peregrinibacteria bacterium]
YSWVVCNSHSFWLVLFAIFIFWFSKLWLSNGRKTERNMAVFLPIIFLSFFLGYGIYEGDFSFSIFGNQLSGFFDNILNVFFGVGGGQFLIALQDLSQTILTPNFFKLPVSGILNSFYEFGIIGILFLIVLVFSPKIFNKKASVFYSILFLFFWGLVNDFFVTENAILFAMVFLFVTEKGSAKFKKKV